MLNIQKYTAYSLSCNMFPQLCVSLFVFLWWGGRRGGQQPKHVDRVLGVCSHLWISLCLFIIVYVVFFATYAYSWIPHLYQPERTTWLHNMLTSNPITPTPLTLDFYQREAALSVCVCVCVCVCVHTNIYAHIYIYICVLNIHIYIYIYTSITSCGIVSHLLHIQYMSAYLCVRML